MKQQNLMLLVVAAACGLVAMFGVRQAMSQNGGSAEEMVQVLQASLEVQPGDLLDETNVRMVNVNKEACPEGAVRSLEEIKERSLKVPAMPGDWILAAKLSEKGEIGAAANIPEGMRAVTIPVDATQTHSGMLRPGNRVDIIMTYDARTARGSSGEVSKTILQYVEVFAVDDRIYGIDKTGEASSGAKNISVLVTPEQGNLLRLAEKVGRLSTALRSNSDTTEVAAVETTLDALGSGLAESNLFGGSALDARREDPLGESSMLFNDEPVPALSEQLQAELNDGQSVGPEGSMPTMQLAQVDPSKMWTIEIREGGKVRMEAVEIPEPKGSGVFWDFVKTATKTLQTP
jgi:pilus assembly protein CpaB